MSKVKQIGVKVKPGRDKKDKDIQFNRALKRWKRLYGEFQIKEELVKRQQFKKPSLLKKEQKNRANREQQRRIRIEKENQ